MITDRNVRSVPVTHSRPNINVTPLIDVLLVMLIIFMIAAPLKPARFLAKVPSKPDETHKNLPPPIDTLVVTIKMDRTLMLNGLTDMGSIYDTSKLSATLSDLFQLRLAKQLKGRRREPNRIANRRSELTVSEPGAIATGSSASSKELRTAVTEPGSTDHMIGLLSLPVPTPRYHSTCVTGNLPRSDLHLLKLGLLICPCIYSLVIRRIVMNFNGVFVKRNQKLSASACHSSFHLVMIPSFVDCSAIAASNSRRSRCNARSGPA